MAFCPRKIAVFLVSLATLLAAARPAPAAGKWQEAHQTQDDVRVTIDAAGSALVERAIRWRVVAGNFTGFDVPFVEKGALLTPDVEILGDEGVRFTGRVARAEVEAAPKTGDLVPVAPPPGDSETLHVTVDEPEKGLRRGVYVFKVAYKIDLAVGKHLAKDGPMWLVRWVGAPSPEGRDGARVTFTLPPAPTEPRVAEWPATSPRLAEGAPTAPGTEQPTLRRAPDKDEIEIVRPHVARGEIVSWTIRVDPKALARVTAPELLPARHPPEPPLVSRDLERSKDLLVALALALGAGLVFHRKRREARALAASRGMRAQPLVPRLASPWLFAPLVGLALVLVSLSSPWTAAPALVLAMALATYRPPVPEPGTTPGIRPLTWLPLRASEVLPGRPGAGSVLDANTRPGKIAVLGTTLAGALLFVLFGGREIRVCSMVLVAILAILPLLVTGTRGQLPFDPARLSPPLALLQSRLSALPDTRVVAIGGFAGEGPDAVPACVRLGVVARDVMSGVRAIEIAQAAVAEPSGWYARPELLVRVLDGSDAEGRLRRALPHVRAKPGRKPEERVFHIVPDEGTVEALADLVVRVRRALDDRRASVKSAPPATDRRRRAPPAKDRAIDASLFLAV